LSNVILNGLLSNSHASSKGLLNIYQINITRHERSKRVAVEANVNGTAALDPSGGYYNSTWVFKMIITM